jgi:hypothetical protein
MNLVHENEPYILVEGPKWADAKFYGKWLLMASKAQALWENALKCPSFKKQMDLMTVLYIPDFELSASLFLFRLEKNLVSFTIRLFGDDYDGAAEVNQFAFMTQMGFFVLTDQRYQMVVPAQMDMGVVKSAALKFAKTEDEEDGLHPEYLIAAMPYAQAEERQTRLRSMNKEQRCADRAVLLDQYFAKQLNEGNVGGCCGRSTSPNF